MSDLENDNNSCCSFFLNKLDQLWAEYKHHSGKVSIGLSVLGGLSSILVGKYIIIGSVAIAITNSAVFMSGIAYEKLKSENKQLNSDCESHKEMLRRFTLFQPNNKNNTDTETNRSIETIEPINFEQIHKNNMLSSYAFPTNEDEK